MATLLLEIDLLGPLRVRQGGRASTRFKSRNTAALLGLLALRADRPQRRDEMIEMLWPEADAESGRNRLRLALSELRRDLEALSEDKEGVQRIVVADRVHVNLDAHAFTTDKVRFETLLQQAGRTDDDAQRIVWLSEAADLYRGHLLHDLDEEWLTGERQQVADAYQVTLRRLVKALAKERQLEKALYYAQRAVEADPLREEAHRSLMQLYAALGRPADALRQYRQMEAQLREALDAVPSAASQQLYTQLRAPAIPSPPTPPETNVSEDAAAQTGAFIPTSPSQASPPALRHAAEMPAQAYANTGNGAAPSLPVIDTPLLGREDEVANVCEMLCASQTRLVTVTGMGGSGKTRLSVEVGYELLPAFSGRVWFVSLASLQDASLLWDAAGGVLPLSGQTTPSPQQVQEELGRAPALLILDNCEHLGENLSQWTADLLQAVPSLTCLATSRQRLNVSREYEYSLAPLPTPQAAASLSDVLACASAQLFVERARQVRPAFAVTPANAADLSALCRSLDGLPLALELAAVWTQTLTLAQIQGRLSSRFKLLVSRQHDANARHRSLRAVLDGSYQMLPDDVQAFFANLSVFRGGWTLEAAETVCNTPEALEYLTQLREHSLITAYETGEQMRYGWLETVREYAAEKLTQEKRTAHQQRHGDYYALIAAAAYHRLYGEEAIKTLLMLDEEQGNWRTALEWGMTHLPLGAQIANDMARYWHMRGHTHEAQEWLLQALQGAESLPLQMRLSTTGNAGNFAYLNADYGAAQTCYVACLDMATQSNSARGIAHALDSLGLVHKELGDLVKARELIEASVQRWREQDDAGHLALAISHLGSLAFRTSDYAFARQLYTESLALYRQVGKHQGIALLLCSLASVCVKTCDYAIAVALLAEGLALSRQMQNASLLESGLSVLTTMALQQGDFAQAARLLGQAGKVRREARVILGPRELAEVQEQEETLQREQGETIFQVYWDQGYSLSLEEIWLENL